MRRFELSDEEVETMLNCLYTMEAIAENLKKDAILEMTRTLADVQISKIKVLRSKMEAHLEDCDTDETHQPEEVAELLSMSHATNSLRAKIFRLLPKAKSGYLMDALLPSSISDIIEDTGKKYGGGQYQLRLIDEDGKELQASVFDIAGKPKN